MDRKLEELLVKRFPTIFRDYRGPASQTCMAWGMSCGDGWYHLLWNACKAIEEELEGTPYVFIADQVKEKFAGLRFYYHIENIPVMHPLQKWADTQLRKSTSLMCRIGYWKARWWLQAQRKRVYRTTLEKVGDIVSQAEMDSFTICEHCSKPGQKPRGRMWRYTLCDLCEFKTRVRSLKDQIKYEKQRRGHKIVKEWEEMIKAGIMAEEHPLSRLRYRMVERKMPRGFPSVPEMVFPYQEDIEAFMEEMGMDRASIGERPIPLNEYIYLAYDKALGGWKMRTDQGVAILAWNAYMNEQARSSEKFKTWMTAVPKTPPFIESTNDKG